MELRWNEGLLEAGCYWTEGENKEIIKEDRQESVIHLLKFQTGVVTGNSG